MSPTNSSLPSIVTPENQGVTFVELFFDLVFVFAITQVAHHAAHHFDAWSLFQTGVVFWLVWWAWTQFTWALNAANTENAHIRLATLIATGIAFVMAASIAQAFGDGAIWFAGAYVAVRLLGLRVYVRVASHDAAHLSAVRSFAAWSLLGLAAVVVGGFVAPDLRPWVWLGAVVLDMVAAVLAARHETWNLQAGHFAERHGLIVIIALGESLIVAGSGVGALDRSAALLLTGVLAVTATCLLWWTYFGWAKDALEARLHAATKHAQEEQLARDVYSFGHFPLICGIVSFAVGLQGVLTSTGDVSTHTAGALGIGIALFVGSTAFGLWRASRVLLMPRVVIVLALAVGVPALAPASPALILGLFCGGLALVVSIEHLRCDQARCLAAGSSD